MCVGPAPAADPAGALQRAGVVGESGERADVDDGQRVAERGDAARLGQAGDRRADPAVAHDRDVLPNSSPTAMSPLGSRVASCGCLRTAVARGAPSAQRHLDQLVRALGRYQHLVAGGRELQVPGRSRQRHAPANGEGRRIEQQQPVGSADRHSHQTGDGVVHDALRGCPDRADEARRRPVRGGRRRGFRGVRASPAAASRGGSGEEDGARERDRTSPARAGPHQVHLVCPCRPVRSVPDTVGDRRSRRSSAVTKPRTPSGTNSQLTETQTLWRIPCALRPRSWQALPPSDSPPA